MMRGGGEEGRRGGGEEGKQIGIYLGDRLVVETVPLSVGERPAVRANIEVEHDHIWVKHD